MCTVRLNIKLDNVVIVCLGPIMRINRNLCLSRILKLSSFSRIEGGSDHVIEAVLSYYLF